MQNKPDTEKQASPASSDLWKEEYRETMEGPLERHERIKD